MVESVHHPHPNITTDLIALRELEDIELVELLREGNVNAYEELWLRHLTTARRVAGRIAPGRAEDLVSESFLTVFQQVHVDRKGPQTAFRAYLFAVMRNVAARWHREGTPLVFDAEIDAVAEDESSVGLERAEDDAIMLAAFRTLPERWQHVLWLSEVDRVSRPTIASALGLRANAVSALQRRAKHGLREQWLTQHLAEDLRADPTHVAIKLPALILNRTTELPASVATHLAICDRCETARVELVAVFRDRRRGAFTVGGLAAMSVILPSAATLSLTPVSISLAAGVGFALAGTTAALLGTVYLGITAGVIPNWFIDVPGANAELAPLETSVSASEPKYVAPLPLPLPTIPNAVVSRPPLGPVESTAPAAPITPITPITPTIEINWESGGAAGLPQRPPAASPLPAGAPPPSAEPGSTPPIIQTTPNTTYFAPTLSGTTPPDSQVFVEVEELTYAAAAAEDGSWDFDLRSLQLPAGGYTATVWSVHNELASAAAPVPFTIAPVTLDGFYEYHPMTLRESMNDGLVFTMRGPARGKVCFDTDTGQSAIVTLDEDGTAIRRLRFLAYGIYVMRLTACDGDYFGADVPRTVSINEGMLDPWIVSDEMIWELDDPTAEEPAG